MEVVRSVEPKQEWHFKFHETIKNVFLDFPEPHPSLE